MFCNHLPLFLPGYPIGNHYKFGEKLFFLVKLHQTLSKAKARKTLIFRAF